MNKTRVKVGEINFELTVHDEPDREPTLEIENDASMVFESVSVDNARAIRDLMERFIGESRDFNENMINALL